MSNADVIFSAEVEKSADSFTKRDFLRIVFRHIVLILLCFVVFTSVAVFLLFSIPPTYKTDAKVLIKTSEDAKPSFFSGITSIRERPDIDPSNRVIETEVGLVGIYPIAEKVVDDLGLHYDQVYHSAYVHLLNPIVDAYDRVMESYFGVPEDPDKRGRRETSQALVESLEVRPLRSKGAETSSNIISIRLRSPDPLLGQATLKRLLDYYIKIDVSPNEEAAKTAYEIVQADLEVAHRQVLAAEDRLKAFTSIRTSQGLEGGLFSLRVSKKPALARERPEENEDENENGPLHVARPAPLPSSNTGPSGGGGGIPPLPITTPGDDRSIDRLKAQLINTELELAQIHRTYSANHPEVRSLRNLVEDLRRRIDREVFTGATNETQLLVLERDVRRAETRWLDLDRKLEQISLFRQTNARHVGTRKIIDPPRIPKTSDRKIRIFLGGAASVASIVLGLLFAGLLEYADNTLQSRSAVKKYLGLEVLVTIPKVGRRDRMRVLGWTKP